MQSNCLYCIPTTQSEQLWCSTRRQHLHLQLATSLSPVDCAAWPWYFLLIQTSVCGLTSSGLLRSLLLCCRRLTTVTLHWLVFQLVYTTVCSPCSTLLLGLSLFRCSARIDDTFPVFIGWGFPSESSSNCRSSLSTVLRYLSDVLRPVFRTMSPLPDHWQHSVENSKPTYFSYRMRTLF